MTTSDARLLDTLERAFEHHAGSDERIDAAKIREVLGLRTESIAQKMFAIFDENGDGAISREEFVGGVRKLVAGSTHDKLSFAFRLHDEDADGNIDEPELRRMVALGLAEDDVSVGPGDIDDVTRSFFARADTDRNGRISFAEFEAVMTRYPHLLEQMTRTEARWIAPNEDLLARVEPGAAPASSHFLANRRREIVVLAIWIAIHIALFASAFVAGGRGQPTLLDKLGNACTSCIELDLGILVIVAMRRLLTRVRSTWLGRVLPIDHAIGFHRFVGHSVFVFAIGHGVARIVSFTKQTRSLFIDQLLFSLEGLTGVLALAILGVMWFFAREVVRRTRHFELFYFTHLLYLPLLVLAAIHAPAILAASGVGIAALLVEHALRLRRRGTEANIVSSNALRSGVTRLELARPSGFSHEPGDYVFLRLPGVARHEWHPFTLSSAPEADRLTVHARSLGNWTSALRRVVEERGPLAAYVDGPYGSPSRHVFEARFAVMIGAGIGVTPFASILGSIALGGKRGILEKAHFFWLNRDQYSFEWFAALLADLETKAHAERLDIHIHMTGGHAGMSAAGLEVAREMLHETGRADLVTGLQTKTHMGHPDWEKVLSAIQKRHAPDPVHVFFCGPEGLARKIRRISARLGMPFRDEKF